MRIDLGDESRMWPDQSALSPSDSHTRKKIEVGFAVKNTLFSEF